MMVRSKMAMPCLTAMLLAGCVTDGAHKPDKPFATGVDPFTPATPVGVAGATHADDAKRSDVWFLNGDHRPPPALPESAVTIRRALDDRALPDDSIPSSEAVIAARAAALQEPVASSFVGAAAVHPYVEGAVYKVHTAPGALTTISLQPGEEILELAAGDTARWLIREASSGSDDITRPLIFIKPLQPKLRNNLTVATSRRVYQLDLESHPQGQYQTEIAWRYPGDAWRGGAGSFTTAEASPAAETADRPTQVHLGALDFGYAITSRSGDTPDWMPVRAFHDGAKTYIQFPPDITTKPPLFVIRGKQAEIVNYRLQGDTYVVDRVLDVAELRLGDDDQTVVRVTRHGRS